METITVTIQGSIRANRAPLNLGPGVTGIFAARGQGFKVADIVRAVNVQGDTYHPVSLICAFDTGIKPNFNGRMRAHLPTKISVGSNANRPLVRVFILINAANQRHWLKA
ncbi:hypothetical protein D3C86_1404520 [compost metagenome]